jgi:hypothetical protein
VTDPTPLRPSDSVERKLLADESLELLENHAFTAAILTLRKEWFAELMRVNRRREMMYWTMKLQALEAIPQRLQIFVNDQKMHEARKK